MNSKNSSRRKFIQKSGAVAGVTIIPSKSVWGMCNSSGVSGGSKDTSDACSVDYSEFGGRSGGSWGKFLTPATTDTVNSSYDLEGRDSRGVGKIHGMFSEYSDHKWNHLAPDNNDSSYKRNQKKKKIRELKKMYDKIQSVIADTPDIDLGGTVGGEVPAAKLALSEALRGGGIARQLACVYLNLYFEFIERPISFINDQQYMEHLWGLEHKGSVDLETLIDNRYDKSGTSISSYSLS